MEILEKKEWGTILAIVLIVLVILVFAYSFIFGGVEKENEIKKNKENAEVVDNQNNTFKETEIDIKEIEKRLDELDVNVDDIFEQL